MQDGLLARCLLAASLAGLVEVSISAWRGEDAGVAFVLVHLVWLALLGLLFAAMARLAQAEHVAARLWLVAPAAAVVVPFLDRRLGFTFTVIVAVMVVAAIKKLPELGGESVGAGGFAGALLGARTALFFVKQYDGRETAPSFLVALAAVAALAAALYYTGARLHAEGRYDLPSSRRSLTAAAVIATSTLLLADWTGEPVPAAVAATAPSDSNPPVVVVVLDTVRADHLDLYGYERRTMPLLAEFARDEAVTVERAITNAPDSLASHASLFTGLFPANHGAHRPLLVDEASRFGYPLRDDAPTLASVLGDAGYATLAVSANYGPASAEIGLGIDRGFDVYRSQPDGVCAFARLSAWRPLAAVVGAVAGETAWMPPCRRRYRRAAEITDEAIGLVDAAGTSSFLLFVNYMDAHGPYDPPAAYRRLFEGFDPSAAGAADSLAFLRGEEELPAATRDHLVSQYDGELAYLDGELARLLGRLQRHPAWQQMVVVITSDHGEAFGEHRLLDHSSSLYDVMIRVPLILKGRRDAIDGLLPGPGVRWDRPMQLVDVMPLVLDQLGIDPPASLDGRPPGRPQGALRAWSFPPRAKVRFSDRFRRELRSIEIGGFKLIEDHAGALELYDLAADPGERNNLVDLDPERAASMLAAMGPWTTYRAQNPPEPESLSPEALERLRSLGYIR